MTSVAEAVGIVQAARAAGLPVVVSFSVNAHGAVNEETTLAAAITAVDTATDAYPVGYFVNCAHPAEAAMALPPTMPDRARRRVTGFRLNAATSEHHDTQAGDGPEEFASKLAALHTLAPHAHTFGGCCGTDVAHIEALTGLLE